MEIDNRFADREIFVIIDNIRSAFNVGSIFRTCDGVGGCMLMICGISPTPENPKVLKTSLSAEKSVPWTYYEKTIDAINELKKQGIDVYAAELTQNAEDFRKIKYPPKVGVIFGHEKKGISDDVIKETNGAIAVPMLGQKNSLNVAVCAGVILYQIRSSKQ